MSSFVTPDKSSSRAFQPNGVYSGVVTRTDEDNHRVWVEIPRFIANFQFGPLAVACTDMPQEGDLVACFFVEDRSDDIMVLGVIKQVGSVDYVTPIRTVSTDVPTGVPVGTIRYDSDTTLSYIWTGTAWVSLGSDGPTGPTGPAGVLVQATPPTNTSVVWVDTASTGSLFAPYRLTSSVKSSNYTLALADEQTMIEVSVAATIRVPTNTSVPFAVGTQIKILATGIGSVEIAPIDGTVTVNAFPTLVLGGQWCSATLIKRATNVWVLVGDLADVALGPAFRSASTAQVTTGSLTTPIPTGTTAGDLLVLATWIHYNGKAGTAGTPPAGWTQRSYVDGPPGNYDAYVFSVYTKTAGGSETSPVWSSISNMFNAQSALIAISGASAVDVVGTRSTGLVASSVTTTTATDLLIGVWARNGGSGIEFPYGLAVPSTMNSRAQIAFDTSEHWELAVATQKLSASGATGTRTATWLSLIQPNLHQDYNLLLAVN